ncbi:MAG: hypothetical protein SFX18_13695 [Pirellulales bacterium]|nr:hypothetical protein [Pirellulales bacterium]
MVGFTTMTAGRLDLAALAAGRYGCIEAAAGELRAVRLRPYPKWVWPWDVLWRGEWLHRHGTGDRLWIYYNQPRSSPDYLALKYTVSTRDCTLATLHAALGTLDEIARLKSSAAIVGDAANFRLSEKILRRFGWVRHTDDRWHRNFIKRFYGEYPATRGWLGENNQSKEKAHSQSLSQELCSAV